MKGHSLFIDNFYSSIGLMTNLLSKRIYITGTCNFSKKDKSLLDTILDEEEKSQTMLF